MTDMKLNVTYFEKPGPDNTDEALKIAKEYAEKFNIKDIVLASTTGFTAEKALEYFDPAKYNIAVIAHAYYFTGKKLRQEFPEDKMEELRKKGIKIHCGTHSMSGMERGLRIKKDAWIFVDLLAKMLGFHFSQGIKVCIEIASMMCDAGLIPDLDRDIIAIAGTGRGADTVCLIKPAPTSEIKELRVKAILAKPLNF
ncbi:MAG: pyruvate kinase alpha/beta domain-containing protein [Promethearchaeota archaeon]